MPTVAETFANAFTEERLRSLKLKIACLGFEEEGGEHDGGDRDGGDRDGDHEMHFVDGETNERDHGQDGGDGGEMHFVDGDTNERGGDMELREDAFFSVVAPVERLSLNDLLSVRNQRLMSARR